MNTTVAIYDSQDEELMDFCTREWIRIGKDHTKLEDKYNVLTKSENEVIEVVGCPAMLEQQATESHSAKGRQMKSVKSDTLCDEIKIAKLPRKENSYSLIKIEFNDLEDPSLLNAANVASYVGVSFTSKN